MVTLQQPAATLPAKRNDSELAVWAIVALVVAITCAVAGWAYARQSTPSRDDLARFSAVAAQDGAARGMSTGYRSGARAGRAQANSAAKLEQIASRQSAMASGYSAGIQVGRDRAAIKAGDQDYTGLPGVTEAYPPTGYESVLSSGLFGDEPGYSSSSFSDFGYGNTAALPSYDNSGYGTAGLEAESDFGY